MLKLMQDSVSISQYRCLLALIILVWTYTLRSTLDENSLLLLDISLLRSGFLILVLTEEMLSLNLLFHYIPNNSIFMRGAYVLASIYQMLTGSISSNSIWAETIFLVIHLFLHDYSGFNIKAPGVLQNPTLTSCISLNASVVAAVFIASCLPSRLRVFAIMLFSLLVFLFAPLVTYCVKKYSFCLCLLFSFALMVVTLAFVYMLHRDTFHFVLAFVGFFEYGVPLLAYTYSSLQVQY